jgi:protein-L-isoaspartate(D-aspartate) O-methyltransferase
MNFEKARFNMVEQQIRPWDVLDTEVLDLLMAVKREHFVPQTIRNLAFSDTEIPLGGGEFMLAPRVEARVMQALQVRKADRVLEIGAGSGFMAALLGGKADRVWTVDISPDMTRLAKENLERAGVTNVMVELGDASRGWSNHAPYDVIVLSGGVEVVPQALLEQLKPGGRLFAFVGEAPMMEAQLITRVAEGGFNTVNVFETVVPPLRNFPKKESFVF